eukprot:7987431-Pyramimonas_sp.AAC.1
MITEATLVSMLREVAGRGSDVPLDGEPARGGDEGPVNLGKLGGRILLSVGVGGGLIVDLDEVLEDSLPAALLRSRPLAEWRQALVEERGAGGQRCCRVDVEVAEEEDCDQARG